MVTKRSNEYILNYQLGQFVGEDIVRTQLPILDISNYFSESSSNIIKLDKDDRLEYDRLERECWVNGEIDSEKHKIYVKFIYQLEQQYFPQTEVVYFEPILITDSDAFLKGVEFALWDSGVSSYLIDKKEPIMEEGGLMNLTLKLRTQ